MATVTSPVLTDATGANIVTKLEAIKNAVQPANACTDIDITIPTSGWSGSSPYTYTYATAHVTPGCSVKVSFLEGSEDTSIFYLEYEKVSTGVRFTAPSLPASDIPVRIHILAADAESVAATSADQVTTNAVLGASNVQQALGTLNDQIAPLTKITKKFEGSSTYSIGSFGRYNIAICALYVENTGTSIISVQTVGSSVSIVHIAGTQNATNAISGSISNGTLTLTASNKFTISFINATMNY